jgi:hypothetical protein
MAYSLAQSFFVDRVGGCYATRVDVYFQSKDSVFPVTVQLHEMQNGIPTQKVLPFSRSTLYPNDVFTSENGLAATSFWFESPVFLQGETDYALVIIPGSDSPNYNVWTARLGDTVIGTDRIISKQAGVGVLFISSDGRTFTPYQEYDLKYTLKTANFDNLGTIVFTNGDTDWMTIANTSGRFIEGENISANLTSNLVSSDSNYGNTAGSGLFEDYYEGDTTSIVINPVNEPFTAGSYIRGEESGTTAQIVSIDDIIADSSFLKSEHLEQIGTEYSVALRGRNTAGILDPTSKEVDLNETINFVEPKKIYSYSNEQALLSGTKTATATITLNSAQENVSPAFDDDKFSSYQITNLINTDITDEDGVKGGNALAKYITRRVTLEDGLDAEDMNVYLDAYKPPGTQIYVYYKIHNASDDETFEEKSWKLMQQETSQDTYSTPQDFDDQKEFKYVIPSSDLTGDSGEVQYTNASGATYTGFLTFSVKVVLTASVTSDVPRITDVRVIALQI